MIRDRGIMIKADFVRKSEQELQEKNRDYKGRTRIINTEPRLEGKTVDLHFEKLYYRTT